MQDYSTAVGARIGRGNDVSEIEDDVVDMKFGVTRDASTGSQVSVHRDVSVESQPVERDRQ